MRITSKTVAIISSIVVVVSAGLIYYLDSRDSGEVLGWMSSSWLYRRAIEVNNSEGTELTNESVLITIDTETLITNGKMQSDCDDLRFTDSDGATALKYWVEGGCNTTDTRVWIEITSLSTEGKTIYVYYGNDIATNSEEVWNGKFLSLRDENCPALWSLEGDLENRFLFISSTANNTGGVSSHSHGNYSGSTTGSGGRSSYWTTGTSTYLGYNHTHSYTLVTNSTSIVPPYRDMIPCSSGKFNPYTGMITIFLNSVPTNWTRFSALDSKFPRGSNIYGGTGGNSTHNHTYNGGSTEYRSPSASGSGTGYQAGKSNHRHSWGGGNLSTENNMPPYKTVIWGQSENSTLLVDIILLSTSIPPLGWIKNNSVNEYFPYGSSTFGSTGGASSHTHTVPQISFGDYGGAGSVKGGSGKLTGPSHSHSISSRTTNEQSNLPPYYSLNLIQRKESQSTTLGNEEANNTEPNAPSSLLAEGSTNPSGISDTTPEFSAIFSDTDTEDTGNYYQIEVNTTIGFDGTTMWDSTKTAFGTPVVNGARSSDISYAGTTLQWGTTYYWRIKFWDNNDFASESPWSATANFTMNNQPNAPESLLTEGKENPNKTSLTPYFSATFSDNDVSDTATHYQILVNTSSDFTGTTMWDSTKTAFGTPVTNGTRSSNITYAGSTLDSGTAYYWKIKFWDENDIEGPYSEIANYLTGNPPSMPTSLRIDGKTNPNYLTSSTPPFSAVYSDINGDSSSAYEINVNSNTLFTGSVIWNTGKQSITILNGQRSQDITYNGSPLINSKNIYYWRIRFWDTDNTVGEWSETAYFTDSTVQELKMEGLSLEGINID